MAYQIKILAHRGFWADESEKNSAVAFRRALSQGFGIELDVRDLDGQIVISHDLPSSKERNITFEEFMGLYGESNAPLAINVKSDGLQDFFSSYNFPGSFFFDMSIPDMRNYLRRGLPVFTRRSEYETAPSFLEESGGVWMDEFEGAWIDAAVLKRHLDQNKKVCIVSPELHKRDYSERWATLKHYFSRLPQDQLQSIMLCTDFPQRAKEFFNEN